ncbi:MAG: VOC family protein [Devosiaceae bacterium]|nr:VOC family protein [Devosiaceae bacterium MH13]
MTHHGHFHWNELMTRDIEGAKRFYIDALGWSWEGMPMPDGTYWCALADGEMVAGLFDISGKDEYKDVPAAWMAYIAVDDVDDRVAKAQSAGATIMGPPFDVPGVGRIAMVMQPDGAMIGWMTPSDEPMPQ